MMGDNIILRLQLRPLASKRTHVKAVVYTYWMDDAAPNGAEVWYESDPTGENFNKPLRLFPLRGSISDWQTYIAEESEVWPSEWHREDVVVCTRGRDGRILPPSHPEVLHHLARFEGLALETGRRAGTFDTITYGIIARRLGGIVHASVASWSQLLGKC